MATLADLAEMLNKLVEEVEHLDAQTYNDTLEGVEGAFEVKAEKVVYACKLVRSGLNTNSVTQIRQVSWSTDSLGPPSGL